jgi:hypothetical protein
MVGLAIHQKSYLRFVHSVREGSHLSGLAIRRLADLASPPIPTTPYVLTLAAMFTGQLTTTYNS